MQRRILASPYFHRWHHANDKRSYDKNFCVIFPFLDILFGSFYYPDNRIPDGYGLRVKEQKNFQSGLRGAFIYPFVVLAKRFWP